MNEVPVAETARRMSPEEAAAKADALIASHRTARAPGRRSLPDAAPRPGAPGARVRVMLVLLFGVATGLAWPAHPVLSIVVGIAAVWLTTGVMRGLAANGSTGGERS